MRMIMIVSLLATTIGATHATAEGLAPPDYSAVAISTQTAPSTTAPASAGLNLSPEFVQIWNIGALAATVLSVVSLSAAGSSN